MRRISRRHLLEFFSTAFGITLLRNLDRCAGPSILPAARSDHGTFLPFVGRGVAPTPIAPTSTATRTSAASPTPTYTPASTRTSTVNPTRTTTPENTQTPTSTQTPGSVPAGSRVVWAHSTVATNWGFGNNYYGRYVDQSVVNQMTEQGLMALTGTSSLSDAWRRLIPGYRAGQYVAVKINLNNAGYCEQFCETNCEDWQLKIDALPQPVNALIRGLKQIGVAESGIWVYDATPGRRIPGRFAQRITDLYPGVRFFDDGCRDRATFDSTSAEAEVAFTPTAGVAQPPAQKITDVLLSAHYLINVPIMKKHGGAGVSLSFKNHFGSINRCGQLHDWVYQTGAHYTATYNPLVGIYRNRHIRDKTVLVLGDGLYGDREHNVAKPVPWSSFGNDSPNSLFFATDRDVV